MKFLKVIFILLVMYLDTGCISAKKNMVTPLKEIHIEKVHCLVIGGSGESYTVPDTFHMVKNPTIINDHSFVTNIFLELQKETLVKGTDLLYMSGRPVIFLDQDQKILCAFLYWPASRPSNMFKRYAAYKKGKNYFMGNQIYEGSIELDSRCIEEFDKSVRKYIDVLN